MAQGVDRVFVSKSDISLWFVDNKSTKNISSHIVSARIKEVPFKPFEFNNKRVTYCLSYEEYDCKNKKSRILQLIFYYTDGSHETLTPPEEADRWTLVSPDSVHESLHKYLCKNQRKEVINEKN
jgi:hypothetical protein